MICRALKPGFGLAILGTLMLAQLANAAEENIVSGTGAGRPESYAKFRARIDAQKQCLDKVGFARVKQKTDFTVVTVRPYDTGLYYFEASASFECTSKDQSE